MKNVLMFRSLLVASLAVLSACGGDDAPVARPVPVNPVNPVPAPAPTVNNDYFASQLVPMLQQQYGSLIFMRQVQLMGRTIPAGTHTWATVYNHIIASINSTNCRIQNVQFAAPGGLGNINYNCVQSAAFQYLNIWSTSYVQFEYMRHSNSFISFFEVFNWFLGTGSSYHQNYYYPMYGQQFNPYLNQGVQFDPYWFQTQSTWNNFPCSYGWGGYQTPFYGNGGGFFLRLGFGF